MYIAAPPTLPIACQRCSARILIDPVFFQDSAFIGKPETQLRYPTRVASGMNGLHWFRRFAGISLFPIWLGTFTAAAQIPKFQHIIVIFQENRTPDNLFQGLCSAPFGSAASCSTSPASSQYNIQTRDWLDRNSSSGLTQPAPVPLANQYDLSHAGAASARTATSRRPPDGPRGAAAPARARGPSPPGRRRQAEGPRRRRACRPACER